VIATLRAVWRGGWLALHIAAAFPLVVLFFRRPRHDSRLQRRLFQWWHRGVCRILGVQVVLQGSPGDDSLVAANHVSWLDIPVLASVWHGDFLAKAEVADWPVIGSLVRRSGTLLIRRGSPESFRHALAALGRRLHLGGGACIFPEGTTTDGRAVRRFQPRLFEAAARCDAWVQPVALRYFGPDGELHPLAPFIGDDAFLPHLLRLLRGPAIRVEVAFLPRLSARGHAPRSLAEFTQWQVCAAMERQLGSSTGPAAVDDELLTESRFAV
jgi:1-acyl-sn-glycerol-3-phosphate acyltransferase